MAKHAQSVLMKKQLTSREQEKAIAHAMEAYKAKLQKPEMEQKPLKTICQEAVEEWREKGISVTVSADTVQRRLMGGRSHTEFNAEKNVWLALEEETKVVEYCLALAKRGLPLNHKQLKFHVDSLLQARLGDKFPEGGVSKNWSTQFIQRHSANLGRYWSTSLDIARGRAVNPNMNAQWYKLLGDTLTEKKIEQDCIWAALMLWYSDHSNTTGHKREMSTSGQRGENLTRQISSPYIARPIKKH
jgi:hypothetical protein